MEKHEAHSGETQISQAKPDSDKKSDDVVQKKSEHDLGEKKRERTFGLKAFDVVLYPIVNNIAVFIISVAATYLTSRGGAKLPDGSLKYGKLGQWFQKRGDWLTEKFKGMGMTHGQADMSKMVAFSFIDGSAMAPVVKVVEDHREEIGKRIDKAVHRFDEKDEEAYKAEPKQSWLSVLGGRFVTAGIVVPTAVALDKTGFNDKLFIEPGKKLGEWAAKTPRIAKLFRSLDVRELGKIGIFEAVYTSICTAGLYVSSRFIAKHSGDKKEAKKEVKAAVSEDSVKHDDGQKWASKVKPAERNFAGRNYAHESEHSLAT
jgi:hypothetical protein